MKPQNFNLDSFSTPKVSKSKSEISEAREAVAEGSRSVGAAIVQWDDAEYPGLQRVAGLPALPAPQLNQPLSSSKKQMIES